MIVNRGSLQEVGVMADPLASGPQASYLHLENGEASTPGGYGLQAISRDAPLPTISCTISAHSYLFGASVHMSQKH